MRASLIMLSGCLLCGPLAAQEQTPEMALLEFLGSFETATGQWIDPLELVLPTPVPDEQPEQEPEAQEPS